MAAGYSDPAAVPKAVLDLAKEKNPKLWPAVKAAVLEGQVLKPEELQAIADLPPREVVLGQLMGLMLAPHRHILGVMNAPGRQVATVIDAWRKKQEEGAAS